MTIWKERTVNSGVVATSASQAAENVEGDWMTKAEVLRAVDAKGARVVR